MVVRSYNEEMKFINKLNGHTLEINKGFVEGMNVPCKFYGNSSLQPLIFDDLRRASNSKPGASNVFMPALKQLANCAALPGIVREAIGLPDIHAGYGFAVGSMAAFDTTDPKAIVTPGGIGFDINCGVRVIRTNLKEKDIAEKKEQLTQAMFDHVPVGVGTKGAIPMNRSDLEDALSLGMDWSLREGYSWPEDKEHCEEYGRMLMANPSKVSRRAIQRGLPQLGTLGAGNHYCELQVVDEIFDQEAANCMGIGEEGTVVVMVHTGSRGFGHQVATDALCSMESAMKGQGITVNDKQLACSRISSSEGQDYLKAMSCGANYAWVNRSSMTFLIRQAFTSVFKTSADDLDMNVVYDTSHNVAKFEQHLVDGKPKELLVHRKGATRAFPPHHPHVPVDYQTIGQPVLIGGSMGTNSYILTGTDEGFANTFGTTCHGAGRAASRNKARNTLDYKEVLDDLTAKGISIRVASPKLIMEEAPASYKDVSQVVQTCHDANISKKAVKLRPIAVIKG